MREHFMSLMIKIVFFFKSRQTRKINILFFIKLKLEHQEIDRHSLKIFLAFMELGFLFNAAPWTQTEKHHDYFRSPSLIMLFFPTPVSHFPWMMAILFSLYNNAVSVVTVLGCFDWLLWICCRWGRKMEHLSQLKVKFECCWLNGAKQQKILTNNVFLNLDASL